MTEEFHIASLIIHAQPEYLATVRSAVDLIDGAETHQESAEGKLIVTVEAENEREVLGIIEKIETMQGTLSAIIVYHQVDTPSSQDQAGDLQ